MGSFAPRAIGLELIGVRPLYRQDVLLPLLRQLQSQPLLAAELWGLDQHTDRPYDEQEIARLADGAPLASALQLRRGKRIQYSAQILLGRFPGVSLQIAPQTPARDWPALFVLGDALAEVYQPDIAWVHISADLEPPFDDPQQETRFLIDSGVVGAGVSYEDFGPGGFGLRTYIGPRFVELFGRDLLLSTPAVVAALPWGGVRVDLVEQPWQADAPPLTSVWRAAMEHVRPAQVFSTPERDEDGYVSFRPSRRFSQAVRP